MIFIYVGLFVLAVLGPRLRKARGGSQTLDSTDLFLAGRAIPLWMAIFTMTATWVGGGYLAGTAEWVYAEGQAWAQAGWGYALSLIFGGLIYAKVMRDRNYTTMLDPLEQKFGFNQTAFLYLFALLGEVLWTAAIMTALGAAFSTILGIDMTASIIITAGITIAYTAISGLWAVAYTDVVQLTMVLVFLSIAAAFAIPSAGGWTDMWSHYNSEFGSLGSGFIKGYFPPLNAFSDPNWGNWTFAWIDYGLLYIFGGIPWHCYFQRVLGSKDGNTARRMSIGAGVLCFFMVIPPTLIAVAGFGFDWESVGAAAPDNPAMILPYVLRYAVPPIVGALGLGAVAAAVMSSVDSSVLSASTMFTWNIFNRMKNHKATDKQLKSVLRTTIIVVGVAATLISLQVKSVRVLWYFNCDLVYITLFPALTVALFVKFANKYGVYAGVAVALVLRFLGGIPEFDVAPLFHYWIVDHASNTVLFPFRTFAMLCGMATMIVVSYLTRKIAPQTRLEKIEIESSVEKD